MLNPDFKEFIEFLNANQVSYLVIGGYAVALHGYPRYTIDIDIWLDITPENAERTLWGVPKLFGFGSLDIQLDDFLTPGSVVQLGYPPSRIDLITTPDGVDFTTCYASKVEVSINGIVVNFIDLENLKINKRVSGRLQDLADLENLESWPGLLWDYFNFKTNLVQNSCDARHSTWLNLSPLLCELHCP